MKIRSYLPQDYDSIVALYRNKAAYGGSYDIDRDQPDRLEATAKAGNLFVAENNGDVVGTFMILDNPHSFWLLRFAVDPSLTEADKVTNELAKKVTEIAKERNHQSVITYTSEQDRNLNKRLSKLSFIKGNLYRSYWKEV